MKVATFLDSHPLVEKVVHPGMQLSYSYLLSVINHIYTFTSKKYAGLKSHPQHQLAIKQQKGHSGMIGFYIKGGFKEAAKFMESVKVIKRAPSLGADISLVTIP